MMKLLANENFPLKSVVYLKNKGYDISSIGFHAPGITDRAVMEIAIKENRTIITFDRDYGELIFKHDYRPQCGVIYIRLEEYTAVEPGLLIDKLISSKEYDFRRALTVIDMRGLRQKRYS
jgi:predicted nuclease of predicted toxin-antitoxin system